MPLQALPRRQRVQGRRRQRQPVSITITPDDEFITCLLACISVVTTSNNPLSAPTGAARRMLMWEDGFCRPRVAECLEDIDGEDPVRKAFIKMSIQLYNYGEGWVLGRCSAGRRRACPVFPPRPAVALA